VINTGKHEYGGVYRTDLTTVVSEPFDGSDRKVLRLQGLNQFRRCGTAAEVHIGGYREAAKSRETQLPHNLQCALQQLFKVLLLESGSPRNVSAT
jgi:hypothetical protein